MTATAVRSNHHSNNNFTSKLKFETLPNIPNGNYSLYIATRYAGGNTLLKERRRLNYRTAIKII